MNFSDFPINMNDKITPINKNYMRIILFFIFSNNQITYSLLFDIILVDAILCRCFNNFLRKKFGDGQFCSQLHNINNIWDGCTN